MKCLTKYQCSKINDLKKKNNWIIYSPAFCNMNFKEIYLLFFEPFQVLHLSSIFPSFSLHNHLAL